MRNKGPHNQIQKPRTNLGGTSGNNPPAEGLVKLALEFAKSVPKTGSKVQESKTYNKVISNPIHENRWWEAIDKELWNLDLHQTWSYSILLSKQKAISCMWIFKVKYHPDGSIERYKACLVAQGFFRVHGFDYTKIFIPIITREPLRIFLAIAALWGMIILEMDVIYADLERALS